MGSWDKDFAAKLSVQPKKMLTRWSGTRCRRYPGCPGVGAIFSIFRASLPSTG